MKLEYFGGPQATVDKELYEELRALSSLPEIDFNGRAFIFYAGVIWTIQRSA